MIAPSFFSRATSRRFAPFSPQRSDASAAYVFTRGGGIWSQAAKLTGADGATFDPFGGSVSIDDRTVAIGARNSQRGRIVMTANPGITELPSDLWLS
jgi:hypothetical protein